MLTRYCRRGRVTQHAPPVHYAAVDAVAGGDADNAFCAVRPPGTTRTEARQEFCLFRHVRVR